MTVADSIVFEENDGALLWMSGMEIDDDGAGPSLGDPDYQNDTSLHHNGKPLNAEEVPYVVVPPEIIFGVKGIVLGCKALVRNTANGASSFAVVADRGPANKIGEGSVALAKALGIPSSPTTGGTSDPIISFRIWPGVPAVVNDITYDLQPSS